MRHRIGRQIGFDQIGSAVAPDILEPVPQHRLRALGHRPVSPNSLRARVCAREAGFAPAKKPRQHGGAVGEHPMPIESSEHWPRIVVVTIENQPRRNAMSRAMLGEIAAIWARLENSAYRCVVITGAGDRAFTSGADLSGDLSAGPEMAQMVNRALLKNSTFSRPIVAAVNGDCIAGGIELLLSTDIRAAVP